MFPKQTNNKSGDPNKADGLGGATSSADDEDELDHDTTLPTGTLASILVAKSANSSGSIVFNHPNKQNKDKDTTTTKKMKPQSLVISTTSTTPAEGGYNDSTTPITAVSTPSTINTATTVPPVPVTNMNEKRSGSSTAAPATMNPANMTAVAVTPAPASSASSTTNSSAAGGPAKLLTTIQSISTAEDAVQREHQRQMQPKRDSNNNGGSISSKSPSCSSRLFHNSNNGKKKSQPQQRGAATSRQPPSSDVSSTLSSSNTTATASPNKTRKSKKPPRTQSGTVAGMAAGSPRQELRRGEGGGTNRPRSVSTPRPSRSSSRTRAQRRPSIDNSTITMEDFVHKSSRVQAFLGNAWQQVKQAATSSHRNGGASANSPARAASNGQKKTNKKKKRRRGSASVKDNSSSVEEVRGVDQDDEQPRVLMATSTDMDDHYDRQEGGSSRFIREQATEIWRLKQQLEQAQEEYAALKTNHENLRLEFQSSQSRAQRAQNALRLATENVRSARAEADAAETTAAHLAQQLEDLQTVVEETKKASLVLQSEQELVEKKVARAQTALHHKGLELARAHQKLAQHQEQQELFQSAQQAWQRQEESLQAQLAEQTKLVHNLERQHHESHALAEARLERLSLLQEEWRQAQTLLEEATQSKLETQETVVQLSEAIAALQLANGNLHKQLQSATNSSHESTMQQQDALHQAERATLQARIQKESLQEELDRLQFQIKQQQQQNQRATARASSSSQTSSSTVTPRFSLPPLASASSQKAPLAEDTSNNKENAQATPANRKSLALTTPLAMSKKLASTATPSNKENAMADFETPTISNRTKDMMIASSSSVMENDEENKPNNNASNLPHGRASTSGNCAICNGMAYGLMKRCQCGKATCTQRAHLSCANRMPLSSKASLSHPGAPTMRIPMVLCSLSPTAVVVSSRKNQDHDSSQNTSTASSTNTSTSTITTTIDEITTAEA
ncbi:hypothetical protein ACA910_008007 [Epithemia clementina (nom. ined.)]